MYHSKILLQPLLHRLLTSLNKYNASKICNSSFYVFQTTLNKPEPANVLTGSKSTEFDEEPRIVSECMTYI